jgi:hypothetical protein
MTRQIVNDNIVNNFKMNENLIIFLPNAVQTALNNLLRIPD